MQKGDEQAAVSFLEYAANPQKLIRRRRIRRTAYALTLLLAIGVIYHYRGFFEYRIKQAYWFHQAMNHVTPPNTPLTAMYDKAVALAKTNPEYIRVDNGTNQGMQVPYAMYVPTELKELGKYVPVIKDSKSPIFFGSRKTPAGKPRLVVIDSFLILPNDFPQCINAVVCAPPTLFGGVAAPVLSRQASTYRTINDSDAHKMLNLKLAIPDPIDQTHLTIPYNDGVVEGYLGDDGKFTWKVRQN